MDGCICLSNELVDPDFPVLWEEMAASASGRLSSSSWLLMNKIRDSIAFLLQVLCEVFNSRVQFPLLWEALPFNSNQR